MNTFRILHRSILVLFAVVVIAIITLVHVSIAKIVAEQSRAQQQSMSPAFSLITSQILKPLHVSEALGRSQEIQTLMAEYPTDQDKIFATLTRLAQEFDLSFFIASEQARMQYYSDGTQNPLIEGEVSWYFKYKARPEDKVADIGKWEDTHFYIDIKIYDDNGKFLGFFGIGKSLQSFISIFDTYKRQYGYDFLFVDHTGDIMLSSDPLLNASQSQFTNMSELAWFASLPNDVQDNKALNNRLVTIDRKDYLIAEVQLNQFDWTMYLLSPLDKRQTEISQGFIFSVVTILVIIFSLFLLVYNLLFYFRRDMQPELVVPVDDRLPDRTALQSRYQDLSQQVPAMSIILVDIDKFTEINDRFGRNAGDIVIERVVNAINETKNDADLLGRWSSQEFILLMPNRGPHDAQEFAQQLRYIVATLPPIHEYPDLQVTASFGVTFTASPRTLAEMTACAEDALYEARRGGGNLVRMQLMN